MQVTNQDISAMMDCLSDMFGKATVSINFENSLYTYNHTSDVDKKTLWRMTIHAKPIIMEEFKSWEELRAWVHAHDEDFSEQVLITE